MVTLKRGSTVCLSAALYFVHMSLEAGFHHEELRGRWDTINVFDMGTGTTVVLLGIVDMGA